MLEDEVPRMMWEPSKYTVMVQNWKILKQDREVLKRLNSMTSSHDWHDPDIQRVFLLLGLEHELLVTGSLDLGWWGNDGLLDADDMDWLDNPMNHVYIIRFRVQHP